MGYPNTRPYEIIGAPFTLWTAAPATAMPQIDVVPPGSWTKVGTSGDLNYLDEGVTVAHPQAFNFFRALGEAGSRKAFRTEEDLEVRLTLVDVSVEYYRQALNDNTITTVAAGSGVPGTKKVGLTRGLGIATMALLVRGPSPYGDDMTLQYWVPVCVQIGASEIQFRRDQPAGLALVWHALVDQDAVSPSERFGILQAQNAAAL